MHNNNTIHEEYFLEQINTTENNIATALTTSTDTSNSIKIDLTHYLHLEQSLLKLTSHTPSLKHTLYTLLLTKFTSHPTRKSPRNLFITTYKTFIYLKALPNLNFTSDMQTFPSPYSTKLTSLINIAPLLKTTTQTFIHILNTQHLQSIGIQTTHNIIPYFIYRYMYKLIKQKLLYAVRAERAYRIKDLQLKHETQFRVLFNYFHDFYEGYHDIFDVYYFKNKRAYHKTMVVLFKCVYYANELFIKSHVVNEQMFINKANAYMNLMHVDNNVMKHEELLRECLVKENCARKCFEELFGYVKVDKDVMMFIMFSLGMMLNGIAICNDEGKSAFTPRLMCSAQEQIFMKNFIKSITYYDTVINGDGCYLNVCGVDFTAVLQVLNTKVFESIIKSYANVLYDQATNKIKRDITLTHCTQLLDTLLIDGIDDETDVYREHTLDEFQRETLYTMYTQFKPHLTTLTPKPTATTTALTLFKPVNVLDTSTHVCIVVPGVSLETPAELKLRKCYTCLNSILVNKHYSYVDYYVYTWQNVYNMFKAEEGGDVVKKKEKAYYNELAKVYGKLLAYIVASREVFQFHTVSLIGVHIGCKVVKECLKTLAVINGELPQVNVIEDVAFVEGCMKVDMDKTEVKAAFELVNGNIWNAYNKMAFGIMNDYGKECVGLKEVTCGKWNNVNGYLANKIRNVDITKIMDNTITDAYLEINNILDYINI